MHQGDLLLAMHQRLVDDKSGLPKLVTTGGAFARNTASNIPTSDLLPLALLPADIVPDDVAHIPLAGSTGSMGGASVVYVDAGDTFIRIRDGHVGPDTPSG